MIDLTALPPLAPGVDRIIYVRCLSRDIFDGLVGKGYYPIDLFSLPRTTEIEKREYLFAKAQALEEQTIELDDNERKVLELEMRAMGMLGQTSKHLNFSLNLDSATASELLSWSSDRHTLAGNSTVQSALVPGKKDDDDGSVQ